MDEGQRPEAARRTKAAVLRGSRAKKSSLAISMIEQKQQQVNAASWSMRIILASSLERPTEAQYSSSSGIWTFSSPTPASMRPSILLSIQ